MAIGLIGAGNMASALARGWGEPVLVSDRDHARAEALAAEVGGEALATNADVARRADIVVLAHKPAQLEDVAREIRDHVQRVVSILGGTRITAVEAAYPGVPVFRVMPNVGAEVRRGVFCLARGGLDADRAAVRALFEPLGTVIDLPEQLLEPATALMGCGPAFFALFSEALVDAGVAHGLEPADAALMTVETMAGTAALLTPSRLDTAGLRRRVTSPGGSTARGLAALEHAALRAACADAVDAVVGTGA